MLGGGHSSVNLYDEYMFRFKPVITSHIFFNVCVTDNIGTTLDFLWYGVPGVDSFLALSVTFI